MTAKDTSAHPVGPEPTPSHGTEVTLMVVLVLTTLTVIGPLATDMYIPAFPAATEGLGTVASRMQLTLTAFFLGTAGGQIVAGPLSDRTGRRLPLLIGILVCLIGSIGCALSPDVITLIIFRVLQGIGGGFGMVLGRAVLIDLASGLQLFRVMNLMHAITGIAPIIAPLLGGLILLVGQWREIFWLIAGTSLISLIGVITTVPESLPPHRRSTGGFRALVTGGLSLLRRRTFVAFLMVSSFSAFALMSYVSASSFVVQDMLGFDPTGYSITFAVNATGMMLGTVLSARLAGTVHPRTLVAIGLGIAGSGAVLLLIAATLLGTPTWLTLIALFIVVTPQGLILGNAGGLASQEAAHMAGTGSMMLGLGFSFSASVAAPVVGVAGNGTAVPMALGILGGMVLSALCFLVEAGRQRGVDAAGVEK